MMNAAGRPDELAVLRIRSPEESLQDYPPARFNLIGNPRVPCSTYAQMIVDTHAAHRAGSAAGNSDFFNQRAMEHIARCLELMRALELPFNLRTAYNLLANKDHLKNTLDTVVEHPRAQELLPLVQHFETFYLNLKSEGQSEGELGTIGNFLAPYQQLAIAEVFCSEEPDTISIDQVDQGKKICLSISEEYAHERKYVFSILKLLFYQHGLRRLDLQEVRVGPGHQLSDRGVQRLAELGERVVDARRHGRVRGPGHDAVALQPPQGYGKHARGDTVDAAQQLAEPARPVAEPVHHVDGPLVADPAEHSANPARGRQRLRR